MPYTMKKILKITGIILLVLVLLLVASPFLFRGKLEDLLKKTINNNVNAQVAWSSLDLSLLRSFPDATVVVQDFTIITNAPFLGDTLASGKELRIEMGISQLFKNTADNPIAIDALKLKDARVLIKVDSLGNANYDIAIPSDAPATEASETSKPFVFNLQQYSVTNSQIVYDDATTQTHLELTEVNHQGSGDFSAAESSLDTQTKAVVSFDYGGTHYLDGHTLTLDAIILMDLENQKYTFNENLAKINDLPLEFQGFVQLIEEGSDIDLSFKTPNSDFKNFLAIIPSEYRKNLDGVETSGDFRVSGIVKGQATETTIPNLDIEIVSTNASFKYPDLPKQMNNINIDVKIKNDSGIVEQTYIEINDLRFKIDSDAFIAKGVLRNLMGNMLVDLELKGALDLGNINKVYPMELDSPLQGKLTADISTSFDMNSVEKQQYQNIKSEGTATLSDFNYATAQLPNAIAIQRADLSFKTGNITLNSFQATSGQTDINATGTIENLIPFVMSKEDLKGRFNVTSKVFNLNDFATTETASTSQESTNTAGTAGTTQGEAIKIPDFLDASLSFKADKVIYDDLELNDTQGTISIANEEATITKLTSGVFGGAAGISGTVTTKSGTPTFNMVLDLSSIDIDRSFKGLDMLQGLAPIAKALQGAFNTKINLKGTLDENFSPILSTLSGDAFAQILTAAVNPEQMPLLSTLDAKLDFINLKDVNLDALKASLTFADGKVNVRPFDFDVKGINVKVSGGHSFTNEMSYTLNLDVPARYLGSDVNGLLSKLTATEKENLSVALPVSLSGNFAKPNVNLDLKTATTALTNQIVEIQKQRVKNKVEDKLDDVLGGLLGGTKPKPTGTSTDATGNTGTAPKPTSTEVIKDVAGGILGGLFGNKKKETKKDTVN